MFSLYCSWATSFLVCSCIGYLNPAHCARCVSCAQSPYSGSKFEHDALKQLPRSASWLAQHCCTLCRSISVMFLSLVIGFCSLSMGVRVHFCMSSISRPILSVSWLRNRLLNINPCTFLSSWCRHTHNAKPATSYYTLRYRIWCTPNHLLSCWLFGVRKSRLSCGDIDLSCSSKANAPFWLVYHSSPPNMLQQVTKEGV